jgi:hypothetical protein
VLLDEYPTVPALVVADHDGKPVALVGFAWPHGLVEALSAFTMSDTPRVELVTPAWLRPLQGDGAVCPCGGNLNCAGCGGTGIYRGASDAVLIYGLTPEGAEDPIACTEQGARSMAVLGGFVPRAFAAALAHRKRGPGLPVPLVLDALAELGMSVRAL